MTKNTSDRNKWIVYFHFQDHVTHYPIKIGEEGNRGRGRRKRKREGEREKKRGGRKRIKNLSRFYSHLISSKCIQRGKLCLSDLRNKTWFALHFGHLFRALFATYNECMKRNGFLASICKWDVIHAVGFGTMRTFEGERWTTLIARISNLLLLLLIRVIVAFNEGWTKWVAFNFTSF